MIMPKIAASTIKLIVEIAIDTAQKIFKHKQNNGGTNDGQRDCSTEQKVKTIKSSTER